MLCSYQRHYYIQLTIGISLQWWLDLCLSACYKLASRARLSGFSYPFLVGESRVWCTRLVTTVGGTGIICLRWILKDERLLQTNNVAVLKRTLGVLSWGVVRGKRAFKSKNKNKLGKYPLHTLGDMMCILEIDASKHGGWF